MQPPLVSTALHLAILGCEDHQIVVEALMQAEVDPEAKNFLGQTYQDMLDVLGN